MQVLEVLLNCMKIMAKLTNKDKESIIGTLEDNAGDITLKAEEGDGDNITTFGHLSRNNLEFFFPVFSEPWRDFVHWIAHSGLAGIEPAIGFHDV